MTKIQTLAINIIMFYIFDMTETWISRQIHQCQANTQILGLFGLCSSQIPTISWGE